MDEFFLNYRIAYCANNFANPNWYGGPIFINMSGVFKNNNPIDSLKDLAIFRVERINFDIGEKLKKIKVQI